MPMPFTRPIRNRLTVHRPAELVRGSAPPFFLPPSNPIPLPYDSGSLHTIKNPGSVIQVPALRRAPFGAQEITTDSPPNAPQVSGMKVVRANVT